LHAPSRTTLVVPSFALEPVNVPETALRTYSPEVLRPFDAPSPRSPLPGPQVPTGSHPTFSCRPRRGIPHPLRSAFAVFHGLDGLLLLEPCGLFQPLTPLGLGFLLPTSCPSGNGLATAPRERGGWTVRARGSRTVRRSGALFTLRSHGPPLRPPKRPFRFRLPGLPSPPITAHPPAEADARLVTGPPRVTPRRRPLRRTAGA